MDGDIGRQETRGKSQETRLYRNKKSPIGNSNRGFFMLNAFFLESKANT